MGSTKSEEVVFGGFLSLLGLFDYSRVFLWRSEDGLLT